MPKNLTVGDLRQVIEGLPDETYLGLQLVNDPDEVESIELLDVVHVQGHPAGPLVLLNLQVNMMDDEGFDNEEDEDADV